LLGVSEESASLIEKRIATAIILITVLYEVFRSQVFSEELMSVISILFSFLSFETAFFTKDNSEGIWRLIKFVKEYRLKVSEALGFFAKYTMIHQKLAEPGWVNVIPIIYILTGDFSLARSQPVK